MATGNKQSVEEIFVGVRDPRQVKKVEHRLSDVLTIAVCAVLAGADEFVAIEEWAKEKLDWIRRYLPLKNGIPSHDTFGRVFAAIDPEEFGSVVRR